MNAAPALASLTQMLEDLSKKRIKRRLDFIYSQIPVMPACDRCAKCCFMSAEVYYIEFLNILSDIKSRPKKDRDELVKNIMKHELLNLTSLDYQCPFLVDSACSVYDHRPIACRIFGIYPEDDYKESKKKSLDQNKETAEEFRKYYDVDLPSNVINFDVDQCGFNVDAEGNKITIPLMERSRLRKLITEVEEEVIPETLKENRGTSASFSSWFLRSFLSDMELHNMRLASIRAHNEGRFNDELLGNMIAQYKIEI